MFASVLAWLTGHESVLAALGVAIIDFIFSINPNAQSNSVLHWVLAQLSALVGSVTPKGS